MSKRNFILLIIVLALVIAGLFGALYWRSGTTPGEVVTSGTNFLAQFNPFGSTKNATTPGDETIGPDINGDGVISTEEMAAVKLKKVSSMPIAGFTVFSKERLKEVPVPVVTPAPDPITTTETTTETTTTPPATNSTTTTTTTKKVVPVAPPTEFATALRYVERATGNIYQTFADKIEERKFSGTVIPKIYDAYFGNRGLSVVMRHLKSNNRTIETFSGALPKEILGADTETNEVKGFFLADEIKDMSLSPDTSKIFYLTNIGGSAVGTILTLSDNKKVQVFNSAFTEWNSFWPTNNIITLTTKPSGSVLGYMYMIDVAKKSFTQVLGNVPGLTTLMSPNGKLVLVGNNDLSLYVYNTDTKTYNTVGVKTLPEKCVWGNTSESVYCAVPVVIDGATYPDDWYRGELSFSDQIWKISLRDGNTTMIADPFLIPGGEDMDGIKLGLSADENYLFFVNKKDSYLWELELR